MTQGMLFSVPWAFFHCFPSSVALPFSHHVVAAPVPTPQEVAHGNGAECWCGGCGSHHHGFGLVVWSYHGYNLLAKQIVS